MRTFYQAKNGAIYLRNGSRSTKLSHQQIDDLALVVFELNDFDFDEYKKAYNTEIALLDAAREVIKWYDANHTDDIEIYTDNAARKHAMRLLKNAVMTCAP